jgi:hypothetical protein
MSKLPPQFADLERFVALWAFASENERSAKRWVSSPKDYKDFYEATLPEMPAILKHLDSFPLDALPAPQKALYYLALAFAEAAPHPEMYKGASEVPNSFLASRFTADFGAIAD